MEDEMRRKEEAVSVTVAGHHARGGTPNPKSQNSNEQRPTFSKPWFRDFMQALAKDQELAKAKAEAQAQIDAAATEQAAAKKAELEAAVEAAKKEAYVHACNDDDAHCPRRCSSESLSAIYGVVTKRHWQRRVGKQKRNSRVRRLITTHKQLHCRYYTSSAPSGIRTFCVHGSSNVRYSQAARDEEAARATKQEEEKRILQQQQAEVGFFVDMVYVSLVGGFC